MPIHKLRQGEDIVSVTSPLGIPWKKVWGLAENTDLRGRRTSPHLLMPGDEIFLPEREPRSESCASEAKHRFRVKPTLVRFRARIFDRRDNSDERTETQSANPSEYTEEPVAIHEDVPVADTPFELIVDSSVFTTGTTDADGFVDVKVPVNARSGLLKLNPGDDDRQVQHPLNWRHLNPVEEVSGVCQRLTNLGFPCPDDAAEITPQVEMAIAAFQNQYGLEPTGRLDQALRTALVDRHGS